MDHPRGFVAWSSIEVYPVDMNVKATPKESPMKATMYATYDHYRGTDIPQSVSAMIYLDPKRENTTENRILSRNEAQHLAAEMFPKTLRVSGTTSESSEQVQSVLTFHASLTANGTNGGVNEAGIKRYRRFVRALEQAAIPVEWVSTYGNAYPSPEALDEALAR